MIKYFLLIILFITTIYAKECFKDKSLNKIVCYKKYFDKKKIHNVKFGERYYLSNSGSIFSFNDKIELKLYSAGAILSILKDFEVDFYDKKKGETYILKVKNPNELFSITSNLNRLTSVKKAAPLRYRKYTKSEIRQRLEASKKRRAKALQRIESKKTKSKEKTSASNIKGNFLNPSKNKAQEPKNFLKGGF